MWGVGGGGGDRKRWAVGIYVCCQAIQQNRPRHGLKHREDYILPSYKKKLLKKNCVIYLHII